MPAKSKAQQRLMGMVTAYKKGILDLKDVPESLLKKIKDIAGDITQKDAEDFAQTKQKGLPEKVPENEMCGKDHSKKKLKKEDIKEMIRQEVRQLMIERKMNEEK